MKGSRKIGTVIWPIDDDRLAEMLLRGFGDGAHRHVGRPARRPRHNQRHRPGGKLLREGGVAEQQAARRHQR
jgi:hypothetical protein